MTSSKWPCGASTPDWLLGVWLLPLTGLTWVMSPAPSKELRTREDGCQGSPGSEEKSHRQTPWSHCSPTGVGRAAMSEPSLHLQEARGAEKQLRPELARGQEARPGSSVALTGWSVVGAARMKHDCRQGLKRTRLPFRSSSLERAQRRPETRGTTAGCSAQPTRGLDATETCCQETVTAVLDMGKDRHCARRLSCT